MAQRHMCPSMGALRHSLLADVAGVSNCSSRAFHNSAKRLEEQPGDASPAQPPDNRKTRSAAALRQITSLKNRRVLPGGLARGSFPSGQMARRAPQANEDGSIPEGGAPVDSSPRFARNSAGPTTTRGSTPPPGQMARAPGQLRISRTMVGGNDSGPSIRGPNLGGRDRGGGPGARGPGARGPGGKRGGAAGSNRADGGPKRREKKDSGGGDERMPSSMAEVPLAETLSDGMVHQLYRLQRLQWDRVPYEPKYAKGSFAANELIHAGRELFKGESPPVKFWGPLEKRIGVVGMHGAEATLKVRRVGDGDDAPFGQEDLVNDDALEVERQDTIEVQATAKPTEAAVAQ